MILYISANGVGVMTTQYHSGLLAVYKEVNKHLLFIEM